MDSLPLLFASNLSRPIPLLIFIIFVVVTLVLYMWWFKKQEVKTNYPNPRPSKLTRDLSQDTAILEPEVKSIAIRWSWNREAKTISRTIDKPILKMYQDGIVASMGGQTVQLSYEDIYKVELDEYYLTVRTKLPSPTALIVDSSAADSIIPVLQQKKVEIQAAAS